MKLSKKELLALEARVAQIDDPTSAIIKALLEEIRVHKLALESVLRNHASGLPSDIDESLDDARLQLSLPVHEEEEINIWPSDEERAGIAWWNSQPEESRAIWMAKAGNTGRVVDAWRAYRAVA